MATRATIHEFRRPWDSVLGTRSHVQVLRILERSREAMTVREVARRGPLHLRSAQVAVERLVEWGILRLEGSGPRQLVRWNDSHPLTDALVELFLAERGRRDRVFSRLVEVSKASAARSVWVVEQDNGSGPLLEMGLLADSRDVDDVVAEVRGAVIGLGQAEHLRVEVRGWTIPDLETSEKGTPDLDDVHAHLLWGPPPRAFLGARTLRDSRSQQEHDADSLARARQISRAIRERPELVRLAREEIERRIEKARESERQTLLDWLQLLDGLSIPQLARWLVEDSEEATRLRQSMPLAFLRAVTWDRSGE